MTHIFSNVVADISDNLKDKFPAGFDFHSMVKQVCRDANVNISIIDKTGYKLQGLWLSMEHAYKLLATALAVYGKMDKNDLDDKDQLNEKNKFSEIVENTNENKCDRKSNYTKVNEYKESGTDSKVFRNDDNEDEEKLKLRPSRTQTKQSITHSESEESNSLNAELNESNENVSSDKEKDEETQKKKGRGRPRKYPPGFVRSKIYNKYRTKMSGYVKKKKEKTIKSSQKRKRGRPKKLEDDGEGDFPCQDCDLVAKSRNALADHRHRIHLSCPTKCDICFKVFPNFRYMKRHRASHVEPQHCCDICGKMYKIKKAMIDHKKTHDKDYVRPCFDCHLCSKNFCNRYILDCHIKAEHLGQKKSYLCCVCGKSFTTRHSLAEHSNAHTGAKPHVCEICGKGFTYESALRDHKFTHANNKQFVCHLCSKSFNQRSGLKMHLRIHADEKKFVCSECGRPFTQKQALQRHFRVHKGEKPFICKLCSRSFTDASIIRRHMILVHKINKDPKSWREDIICEVKAAENYHVEKIGQNSDENDDSPHVAEENTKKTQEGCRETIELTDMHHHQSSDTQSNVDFYDYETPNENIGNFDAEAHSSTVQHIDISENELAARESHFMDNRKHWFNNVLEKNIEHGPQIMTTLEGQSTMHSDASSDGQNHVYHANDDRNHVTNSHPEGSNMKNQSTNSETYAHRTAQRDQRYPGMSYSHNISGNQTGCSTGSQTWPMYAYYSHLASQFGMSLNDYTYINSHGNPHQ